MRLLIILALLGVSEAFLPSFRNVALVQHRTSPVDTSRTAVFAAKNASEASHEEIEKYRDGMSVIPRSNGSSEVSESCYLQDISIRASSWGLFLILSVADRVLLLRKRGS